MTGRMQNGQIPTLRSLVWWGAYAVCAVWAMHLLPGVDFFLPGIICSLQENNRPQTLWVITLSVLMQEGAGLLAFGPVLMWYAMACVLFSLGRWLFEAENVVFIFLLSLALGAWQVVIGVVMHHLQDVIIPPSRLVTSAALNALVVPLVWFVVHFLREKELRHVHAS